MKTLDQNSFNNVATYAIDCTSLPNFEDGYQKSIELNKLITILHGNGLNSNPAVYWIEIASNHSAEEIYRPYPDFKSEFKRSTPAYKKTFNKWDSKVLYVGKAKSNMAGRIILHLGYEKRTNLQGLQLCHWTNLQNLKLNLNIIYLPKNLDVLVQVFELKLAKLLHPILGKHL